MCSNGTHEAQESAQGSRPSDWRRTRDRGRSKLGTSAPGPGELAHRGTCKCRSSLGWKRPGRTSRTGLWAMTEWNFKEHSQAAAGTLYWFTEIPCLLLIDLDCLIQLVENKTKQNKRNLESTPLSELTRLKSRNSLPPPAVGASPLLPSTTSNPPPPFLHHLGGGLHNWLLNASGTTALLLTLDV